MNRLEVVQFVPIKRRIPKEKPDPSEIAEFWRYVFFSNRRASRIHKELLKKLPLFRMEELQKAAQDLKKNKGADRMGLVAEMIQLGPDILHEHILHFLTKLFLIVRLRTNGLLHFSCLFLNQAI